MPDATNVSNCDSLQILPSPNQCHFLQDFQSPNSLQQSIILPSPRYFHSIQILLSPKSSYVLQNFPVPPIGEYVNKWE